jgi:predicted small lipoprotein YifL
MSKDGLILSAGLLALLAMGLSACGQKGPLYWPQTVPQTAAPAPADTASAPASVIPVPSR